MMERLMERGDQLAAARQAAAVASVAAAIADTVSGATVEVDGSDVTVSGQGLLRQWLEAANLRFLTSSLR